MKIDLRNLTFILSISALLFSCNKTDIKNVILNSQTLVLTNYLYTLNQDFKTKFQLTDTLNQTYPISLDNSIKIGDNILNEDQYTYDFKTGDLLIPKKYITGSISITIEAENNNQFSYESTFSVDDHIKFYIYDNEDYSKEPYLSNKAYSRDKTTGDLLKNGEGEINIKVVPDEGYDIDMFWVKGLYDKVEDKSGTNKDIHTITKIRSNLDIKITSKKLYCKKFASFDNLNDKSISFSWNYRDASKNINKTIIKVNDGSYTKEYETSGLSYTVNNLSYDTKYDFTFVPMLKDNTLGTEYKCSRYILNPTSILNIPYFEINTENNIWPSKKNYRQPTGGTSTVNKENELANIVFYNTDKSILYKSSDSFVDKVKIRGNSSSYYFEKQPYKLKLKSNVDLMEKLRDPNGLDNTHKEWVLLPAANERYKWKEGTRILNTGVANSLCKLLNFEYKPEYKFVSLYMNGDYQGLYLLAEQVSRGNGKNNKQGRYKIDKDGFIVENDLFRTMEDISFKTNLISSKSEYTFKYPDTGDFNHDSECYKYIQNYLIKFENLLIKKVADCFDYFDIDSLARWLLLHDIIKTGDVEGSNIYIYKKNMEDSTKLFMGTPWDFDDSLNGDPNEELAIKNSDFFYYQRLIEFNTFNSKLKLMHSTYKTSIENCVLSYLNSLDNSIFNNLLLIESKRWNAELIDITVQKNDITTFIKDRISYLNTIYS